MHAPSAAEPSSLHFAHAVGRHGRGRPVQHHGMIAWRKRAQLLVRRQRVTCSIHLEYSRATPLGLPESNAGEKASPPDPITPLLRARRVSDSTAGDASVAAPCESASQHPPPSERDGRIPAFPHETGATRLAQSACVQWAKTSIITRQESHDGRNPSTTSAQDSLGRGFPATECRSMAKQPPC